MKKLLSVLLTTSLLVILSVILVMGLFDALETRSKCFVSSETDPDNIDIPENVVYVRLSSITSAGRIEFPEGVEQVVLPNLKKFKGLRLPKTVKSLFLNGLTLHQVHPGKFHGLRVIKLKKINGEGTRFLHLQIY